MIKKNLSILAAAVIAASGAHAGFDGATTTFDNTPAECGGFSCFTGTDGDLFFWAHDSSDANGSFFYNLTDNNGYTVDDLLAGTLLTVNVGDMSAYDTWGIIGASNEITSSYGYQKAGIQLGAVVSNGGPITSLTGGAENIAEQAVTAVNNWAGEITAALGAADQGTVGTGDAADKNNSGVRVASYFQGGAFGAQQDISFYGILDATPEPVFDPNPFDETVQVTQIGAADLLAANVVGQQLQITAVPVPAAAWLFGTALLGLGVVRRKA